MNYQPTRNLAVEAMTAIVMINPAMMETSAFRYVFGDVKFSPDQQTTLNVVVAGNFTHNGAMRAMDMRNMVATALGVSASTAGNRLYDLADAGVLRRLDGAESAKEGHWTLYSELILAAVRQLVDLKLRIALVVQRQCAEPDNPTAGFELLPPEVYFNIVSKRSQS